MANYSTISSKQAGVIFGAWKRGEIEATKEDIDMMYARYVGYGSQTTDANVLNIVACFKACVDALFAHDADEANAAFGRAIKADAIHFC